MVLIDVHFYRSTKTVNAKICTKVRANDDHSDLLLTFVKKGVKKLFEKEGKDVTDDALDAAIGRIETITADASDPGACNLVEFLHEGDTLKDLHSDSTPIITKGIYILLPDENINVDVINVDLPTEPAKKKQKTCAFKAGDDGQGLQVCGIPPLRNRS